MNGYGSHTYSMLDEANQRTLCEISFQNSAGNQEFHNEEAAQMKANDMDFAQRDLMENRCRNFPQWNLKIQVMTEEYANSQDYYLNPFDVKSVASCGLSFDVGVLE
jgi:catalase